MNIARVSHPRTSTSLPELEKDGVPRRRDFRGNFPRQTTPLNILEDPALHPYFLQG